MVYSKGVHSLPFFYAFLFAGCFAGCTNESEQHVVLPIAELNAATPSAHRTSVTGKIELTSVQLNGAIFDGELILAEGDPWALGPGVVIFFFRDGPNHSYDRSPPIKESFMVKASMPAQGMRPHVYVRWRDPHTQTMRQRLFTENYDLEVRFGDVREGNLEGEIVFSTTDGRNTLAGKFYAKVRMPGGR